MQLDVAAANLLVLIIGGRKQNVQMSQIAEVLKITGGSFELKVTQVVNQQSNDSQESSRVVLADAINLYV